VIKGASKVGKVQLRKVKMGARASRFLGAAGNRPVGRR
jgi:hypothetical protein